MVEVLEADKHSMDVLRWLFLVPLPDLAFALLLHRDVDGAELRLAARALKTLHEGTLWVGGRACARRGSNLVLTTLIRVVHTALHNVVPLRY